MPEKPGRDSFAQAMRKAAPYLNLGWTFAMTVLAVTLAGWWLDRWLGTGPWLVTTGVFLGIVLAMVNFLRAVLRPKGEGKPE